mmetsp:Transcript_41598/g.66048  ORF Transcript_41598/g.66048 Transcript_41598/m.66048 type:complete len:216 (+) Transcript_41598:1082-1729(+)
MSASLCKRVRNGFVAMLKNVGTRERIRQSAFFASASLDSTFCNASFGTGCPANTSKSLSRLSTCIIASPSFFGCTLTVRVQSFRPKICASPKTAPCSTSSICCPSSVTINLPWITTNKKSASGSSSTTTTSFGNSHRGSQAFMNALMSLGGASRSKDFSKIDSWMAFRSTHCNASAAPLPENCIPEVRHALAVPAFGIVCTKLPPCAGGPVAGPK